MFLLKMSAYGEDCDKNKCMSFLIKGKQLLKKNIIKLGKKSATLSIKDLTVNLYRMKNI